MDSKSNDECPYNRKKEDTEIDKGESHMKMEAETGVTWPPSQEMPRTACSQLRLGDRHGMDAPSEPPQNMNAASTCISDFWSPEL